MSEIVTLARHAMATRFELVLHGNNPVALRAAGETALDEIERLEDILSLYRSSSEIAHLNARAAHEPVRVSVPVFRLIKQAVDLAAESNGAFDPTIGPLMRCWGFMADHGRVPSDEELAAAKAKVGWQGVHLDPSNFTVRFARPGMLIDLGAIGKGYAIDCAVDLLREAEVESALIHGGTSSIYGIGHPPDAQAWTIALRSPLTPLTPLTPTDNPDQTAKIVRQESGLPGPPSGDPLLKLPTISLRDRALSVSAAWGKCFQTADKRYGHVIDPRTGFPAGDTFFTAVTLPSTTESDAFSTALLTLGSVGLPEMLRWRPAATAVLVQAGPSAPAVLTTDHNMMRG
jgi:FAD:protein FMN transferase